MKKYNILYLTPKLNIGGEELSTLSLSKEFIKNGHNVYVITTEGPLLPEYIKNNINVILSPINGRSFLKVISGAFIINNFLCNNRIDIIHSQSVIPTIMAYLAVKMIKNRNKPKIIWHNRGIKYYLPVSIIFRFITDFIITNSDYEKNKLLKLKMPENKIKRIHNCYNLRNNMQVPEDNTLLDELSINKNELVILSVGRLVKQKGFEYLLKAMKLISEEIKNIKLIIAGDGHLYNKLKNLSIKYSIEKNVILCGARNDIDRFYSICDIFVLSSVFEPLGNVLLEAMFYSKPVVATDIGGIPEIVEDNKTGFLVPPRNPEILAKKIIQLIENKELREIFGKTGNEKVIKYFTPKRVYEEVLNVYEYLAG